MTSDDIRRLSFLLFGSASRLEAAAAIGRLNGKSISATTVANESELEYKRAQEQVAHFARAKVLVLDDDPARKTKDYLAVEMPYWRAAEELLSDLREREALS